MTVRVKSYIDLEIAKEGRKSHKEMNKDIQVGKWTKQHPPKAGYEDHKCHPLLQCPKSTRLYPSMSKNSDRPG